MKVTLPLLLNVNQMCHFSTYRPKNKTDAFPDSQWDTRLIHIPEAFCTIHGSRNSFATNWIGGVNLPLNSGLKTKLRGKFYILCYFISCIFSTKIMIKRNLCYCIIDKSRNCFLRSLDPMPIIRSNSDIVNPKFHKFTKSSTKK